MLNEAFETIMYGYASAAQENFAQHPLGVLVRREVPYYLKTTLEDRNIIWTGSVGQGNWSDAPWIAALSQIVTDSAMYGYYPVYLFSRTLDSVYLSLNQGMTVLKNEFGTKKSKEILKQRAHLLRLRVPEFDPIFTAKEIDLYPKRSSDSLTMYEFGHAFGKKYTIKNLPGNEQLLSDLRKMLELYRLAIFRGGTEDLDTEPGDDDQFDETRLEEKRRTRLHKTIERNRRLVKEVKRIQGYCCKVCGFNYEGAYGEIGKSYIEAHHLIPISQLNENESISLSPRDDFAVLCANCHRMIHRPNAPQYEEFREQFRYLRDNFARFC